MKQAWRSSDRHVLFCYKNFAAWQHISHIGLGVSCINTAKVLKAHGIRTTVLAVLSAHDIAKFLEKDDSVTHCVISAPWIAPHDIASILLMRFPKVEFAVNCHSNVGFLQADPSGVRLIRQYIDLEQGHLNFQMSANSKKGTLWLRRAHQCPCLYLPNLYYLDYSHISKRPLWNGGTLYIGSFGAQRPLKNLMSAAGAAVEIANALKADVQFWMSSGRQEGGGNTVVRAVQEMLAGLHNIKLIEKGWTSWPQFRDAVRQMHLLISVSYTESFNMITADGVAEGVPSVVSDSIDWAPDYWKASVDQTSEIARIGRQLITDPGAAHDGLIALEQHNRDGLGAWSEFIDKPLGYKSIVNDPFLL